MMEGRPGDKDSKKQNKSGRANTKALETAPSTLALPPKMKEDPVEPPTFSKVGALDEKKLRADLADEMQAIGYSDARDQLLKNSGELENAFSALHEVTDPLQTHYREQGRGSVTDVLSSAWYARDPGTLFSHLWRAAGSGQSLVNQLKIAAEAEAILAHDIIAGKYNNAQNRADIISAQQARVKPLYEQLRHVVGVLQENKDAVAVPPHRAQQTEEEERLIEAATKRTKTIEELHAALVNLSVIRSYEYLRAANEAEEKAKKTLATSEHHFTSYAREIKNIPSIDELKTFFQGQDTSAGEDIVLISRQADLAPTQEFKSASRVGFISGTGVRYYAEYGKKGEFKLTVPAGMIPQGLMEKGVRFLNRRPMDLDALAAELVKTAISNQGEVIIGRKSQNEPLVKKVLAYCHRHNINCLNGSAFHLTEAEEHAALFGAANDPDFKRNILTKTATDGIQGVWKALEPAFKAKAAEKVNAKTEEDSDEEEDKENLTREKEAKEGKEKKEGKERKEEKHAAAESAQPSFEKNAKGYDQLWETAIRKSILPDSKHSEPLSSLSLAPLSSSSSSSAAASSPSSSSSSAMPKAPPSHRLSAAVAKRAEEGKAAALALEREKAVPKSPLASRS